MHKDTLNLFYPVCQTFSSGSWCFMTNPLQEGPRKCSCLSWKEIPPRIQHLASSISGCPFPLPYTSPSAIFLKRLQRGIDIVAVFGHSNATCLVRVESSFHIWKNPMKGGYLCWKRVGCGQVLQCSIGYRGVVEGVNISFVLEPGVFKPSM